MDSTLLAVLITLGIIALVGLFGLIEALGDRRAWHKRKEAERTRTMGVIVGFAEERHRHAHHHGHVRSTHYVTVYYPIVRFHVDGVEYRLKSPDIIPRDEYQEGQSVDLLYDSDSPAHFHLDRGDEKERSTRGTVVFALVWLTCVLASIALLICTNPQLS